LQLYSDNSSEELFPTDELYDTEPENYIFNQALLHNSKGVTKLKKATTSLLSVDNNGSM
jgi:hypothetical protein